MWGTVHNFTWSVARPGGLRETLWIKLLRVSWGVFMHMERNFTLILTFVFFWTRDHEKQTNILGPSRATKNEAQKDILQIPEAGGVGRNREESLKIMAAEARRIKMAAEYQSQIQETVQRMASQEIADESDYEDEDMSDNSVPAWMKEYPSEEDSPEESSQPARPILASQQPGSQPASLASQQANQPTSQLY